METGAHLGYTQSGSTRIVNRLADKGLISRCHSASDNRICCIRMTESGIKMLDLIDSEALEDIKQLLKSFTPDEKRVLIEQLERLAGLL
jgi:DNA-binding MarR family transcriptional regulator